ncbi:LysR substrate binding domain-containing protein [Propionispira arboris]|uniref:LysR substrate binding domain-containing protein n=1 Tax=Propionispira arboris TaxID=84035 RepID=A0A1H6V7F1_9FIRM|nr:LysR family transcriptional regulator substrate-binding protein [Propionispira arboris]SEJ00481.1 LysR substrate binding domain-containing protein [Propionispira arboris]
MAKSAIWEDPFLLVTQKDHFLKKYAQQDSGSEYPKIDLALFKKEPFILLNEGQKIRQISDLILQEAAFEPNVILITKSFETARRLSSKGLGVSFIPRQYIGIFPNAYEADYYYIDQKYMPYWTLCVKAQQHAYMSKAERLFIRMLGSQFGAKGLMD